MFFGAFFIITLIGLAGLGMWSGLGWMEINWDCSVIVSELGGEFIIIWFIRLNAGRNVWDLFVGTTVDALVGRVGIVTIGEVGIARSREEVDLDSFTSRFKSIVGAEMEARGFKTMLMGLSNIANYFIEQKRTW